MASVTLTWTSFDGYMPAVDGYRYPPTNFQIYRKSTAELAFTLLEYSLPHDSLSYTDNTIYNESIYTYLIVGIDKFFQTKSVSIVVDCTSRVPGYSFIESTMRKLPRWTAAWPGNSTSYQTAATAPTGLVTYSLSGAVLDKYTSVPITGATVKVNALDYPYTVITTTAASGLYTVNLPAPAEYNILVTAASFAGKTYYNKTVPLVTMSLGDQLLDNILLTSSATASNELMPVTGVADVSTNNYVFISQAIDATSGGLAPTPATGSIVWTNISTGFVLHSSTAIGVSGYIPELSGGLIAGSYGIVTGGFMAFGRSASTSPTAWIPEAELTYRLSPTGIALGDAIYTYAASAWSSTTGYVTSVSATSTTGATVNGVALAVTGTFGDRVGLQAPAAASVTGSGGVFGWWSTGMSPHNTLTALTVGDYRVSWNGAILTPSIGVGIVDFPIQSSTGAIVHYQYSSVHKWAVYVSASGIVGSPATQLWNWQEFSTEAHALEYFYGLGGDTTNPIYGYSHESYKLFAFGDKGITPITLDPDTQATSGNTYISPLSNDTLLRRVLTAECMPIGTAYSIAETINDDMYLDTVHIEHDSIMWQVSYTPKPAQKLTVSYGGTLLRQAANLWDFINTTDAVWFITKYIDGQFDELNPSKLIYIRNLDVQEVTCLIDANRYIDVCDADDYFEDSTVWIETPTELEESTPEYFKWRTALTISTTGANIRAKVSLPNFIGIAVARYKSSTLRNLTINTPTIYISGLAVNMRPLTFENPVDGLAAVAGIKRFTSESNTDLISRITIENFISGMDADRSALYTTANSLGYLSLTWWDTSTSPLLTLEDDVIDVYIPGLPETDFGNNFLVPESSGSTRYVLQDKKQIDLPYNVNVNSISFSSGALAASGLVDLDRHYSTATISYSYKNYTKTEVNGFITELSVIDGNTPPNLYPVISLRRINSVISAPLAVARATRTLDWVLGKGVWGQKTWLDEGINKLTYTDAELT